MIVVLTAVGLFLYQVIDRSQHYFAYKTNVNVEVVYNTSVAFPSVTLCNQNNFRFDGFSLRFISIYYNGTMCPSVNLLDLLFTKII